MSQMNQSGARTAERGSRVVLHIGTHKTATTTIQDTFWDNADLLARHGVVYPRLGETKGHHGLVRDWSKTAPKYHLPEGIDATLARISADYADKPVTVFLSSEEFSRGSPAGRTDFAALRAKLSGFDQIEVICTLRTQWAFLQSVYLQVSKGRNPPRPPELLKTAFRTQMVDGLWADYNLLLDALELVFAPHEITFVDFDTAVRERGGILGHYLRHLGAEAALDEMVALPGGAVNVSVPPLASWMANVLSEPKPAPDWLVGLVCEVSEAHFDRKVKGCLFTSDEFEQIATHFAPRNERFLARRAAAQPDFVLSPPLAGKLDLFRQAISSQVWIKVARRQVELLTERG